MSATSQKKAASRQYDFDGGSDRYILHQDPTSRQILFTHSQQMPSGLFLAQTTMILSLDHIEEYLGMISIAATEAGRQQQSRSPSLILATYNGSFANIRITYEQGQFMMCSAGEIFRDCYVGASNTITLPLAIWEHIHDELKFLQENDIQQLSDWEREIEYHIVSQPKSVLYVATNNEPLQETLLRPRSQPTSP